MKIFITILSILSLIASGCMVEEMPLTAERETTFKITLKDNSGYMQRLYGTDCLRNTEIILKSNMQGNQVVITTDSNGVASVSGLISDDYLVTTERLMKPDEMLVLEGVSRGDIKLSNVNNRIVKLSSSNCDVEIKMEKALVSSSLIISEISASGPSGSGLYYHDKYIEIYNQTDSVQYLDKLIIAVVYVNSYLGIHFRDDSVNVHSKSIWIFPGNGTDYPIQPGRFVVCAEDAIDHRINAPQSVDLSHVSFEFYKDDAPDVDNPNVPNMIKIYQDSGNDWLIGGERGSLVLAKFPADEMVAYDDHFLIPLSTILDGVEYMSDPTQLVKKILSPAIDASSTGGIQFYTGKSMERIASSVSSGRKLKDENNSSVDFEIITTPTPEKYH